MPLPSCGTLAAETTRGGGAKRGLRHSQLAHFADQRAERHSTRVPDLVRYKNGTFTSRYDVLSEASAIPRMRA